MRMNETAVKSLPMEQREHVKSERVPWDNYFMDLLEVSEKQSTCLLKHVGAVLTKDRRIISMGYNGLPKGIPHCKVCIRKESNTKDYSLCPSVHAEMNCIIQCAKFGVSTEGTTLYVKYMPCFACSSVCINALIERIVFEKPPVDSIAVNLCVRAGIELWKYDRTSGKVHRLDIKPEKLPWE